MNQLKSQATVFYAYTVGNSQIKSISKSDVSLFNLKDIDLLTKKFIDNNYYKPNDIVSFTIIISNIGSSKATNLIINDDLEGISILENSIKVSSLKNKNIDFNFSLKNSSLIIEVPYLDIKDTLYITYQAQITTEESIYSSSSFIYSDEATPIETNKVQLEKKYASLTVSKRTPTSYVYYNTDINYSIIVENEGNVEARDVEVVDELPTTFILREKAPIFVNNTEVTDYDFDVNTHKLTIKLDKIPSSSKNEIIIHGKIIK